MASEANRVNFRIKKSFENPPKQASKSNQPSGFRIKKNTSSPKGG